jgi:DNA excision repair protein ERCC-3
VGIYLPGAEFLIPVSGTFGSRQEEAQRLGRLLRPAPGKVARFYSLVSNGTSEVRYAEKRQRFLVEQGYEYELMDASDIPRVHRQ